MLQLGKICNPDLLKTVQDQRIDPFQSDIFMLELLKSAKDEAKHQDKTTVFRDYHPACFAHYKATVWKEKKDSQTFPQGTFKALPLPTTKRVRK